MARTSYEQQIKIEFLYEFCSVRVRAWSQPSDQQVEYAKKTTIEMI